MVDSADAGNGVKRESKFAVLTQLGVGVGATALIDFLTGLDVSHLPGFLVNAATLGVSGLIAYITAYKTKNSPVR